MVKLELRIDRSEMDMFGHVNNVSFFKYIQAARVNYWETIGLDKLHKEQNIAPILASVNMNFKKPLHYPGHISIITKMAYIRNTSFSFHHQILNHLGEIAAEATDVMVLVDQSTNGKVTFPTEIKMAVEKSGEQNL
ncbi:MAG: acyl-CoA thioesterase [Bacteroidia bacterium]